MINKPIETYKDLVHAKNTYDFAVYYPTMDNGTLNYIFDFIHTAGAKVVGTGAHILFYVQARQIKAVNIKMDADKAKNVKDVEIVDGKFYVIPKEHIISPSSGGSSIGYIGSTSSYTSYSSSSSSSSYSSGGGSSNNNNNNNNNN